MNAFSDAREALEAARFSVSDLVVEPVRCLAFESETILGFVFVYSGADELLARWRTESDHTLRHHQLNLRRAGPKAWNTYTVFLASGSVEYGQVVAMSSIEEDLRGTRKIARGGIRSREDVEVALLSLMPLKSAPRLEAVDMPAEIRQRTTELPQIAVDAFFSDVNEATVAQALEESE